LDTPQFKQLRQSLGFDEVSIVPGNITIDPEQTEIGLNIGGIKLQIPFIAAAMDGVTDVRFAVEMSKAGGLAVLNLEGVQVKYENPDEILAELVHAEPEIVNTLMQKIYSAPLKEYLVGKRIQEIKRAGAIVAASATPASARYLSKLAVEAGADIFVVQSTVTSAHHKSNYREELKIKDLCRSLPVPVMVGNCVSYQACLELLETGASGILVGVGPGAACTSRTVLGIGVPQITATMDCAAARENYRQKTGKYIPIITDGGFRNSGDICKAIAAGADGVMLGSIFAQAEEAPGRGYHWGMATPHPSLPRGTRVKVGTLASLRQILFGPSNRSDGTLNLVGALRTCMGLCGVRTIQELQKAEMVIAPSITVEGKHWQLMK